MPIQYNSKKIIPAPFVSVSKNYDRSGDGNKVGSRFTLTLTGTLLPCKGSPNSVGEFWDQSGYPDEAFQTDEEEITNEKRQKSLQAKMMALRNLFAQDGKSFEIQPLDGSAPIKCYPTVTNIDIKEGQWYDRADYTITLEANELFGRETANSKNAEDYHFEQDFFRDSDGNKIYLSEISENWQLELVDGEATSTTNNFLYRLTHNISATGKKSFDSDGVATPGWQNARAWVSSRLGVDTAFAENTEALQLDPSIWNYVNHLRQENTDEFTGSYSVTESWIICPGKAREDFTVSISSSQENPFTNVRIEGEVVGYEVRDSNYDIAESKWTNAQSYWLNSVLPNLLTRAQTYSGITLNITPLNSSVGSNPISGRINYSYEYDTRPSNCISGAVRESIVVSDKNSTDVFASIPVIGRQAGPVLQDLDTITETSRTLSIEVIVTPTSVCPNTAIKFGTFMAASPATQVNTIVQACEDNLSGTYNQVFKSADEPMWDGKNGRYTRTVTWTFQNCP